MLIPRFQPQVRKPITGIVFVTGVFLAAPVLAQDAMPKRCTGCHTENVVLERVAKIPAQDRRAKVEAFLANHHTPDAAERAAIAKALAEKAAKKP